LVCPGSKDVPLKGSVAQQWSLVIQGGHSSYTYLGKGLKDNLSATQVLLYEQPGNHERETSDILFGDLHVEAVRNADVQRFIKTVKPGEPVPLFVFSNGK